MHQNTLATGLRPDPVRELLSDPLAAIRAYFSGGWRGRKRGVGKEKGKGGEEEGRKRGGESKGSPWCPTSNSFRRLWPNSKDVTCLPNGPVIRRKLKSKIFNFYKKSSKVGCTT